MKQAACILTALGLFFCLFAAPMSAAPAYNSALALRIRGDVDGDSAVTTTDARLILERAAEKIGEKTLNVVLADLDGDTAVTSTDARLALEIGAGKIRTPCPASLPDKELDAPPEGEPVGITPGKKTMAMASYRWSDYTDTLVHIVQTPGEWQYLSACYAERDGGENLGTYDAAFFEENALIVGDMWMGALEWLVEIDRVCRNGKALEVCLRQFYPYEVNHGLSPEICRRAAVAEVPKSALTDVDTLAVYIQRDEIPAVF